MRDMGIYIQEEKIFYYLEAGDNYIGNTIDRIKKTLIQRGLIKIVSGNFTDPGYRILSKEEASKNSYEMKPIFISKHVEAIFKEKQNKESKGFK